MSRINLSEAFQAPFTLLGTIPVIIIPALIASVVGLVLAIAARNVLLYGLHWMVFVVAVVSYLVTLFAMAWITIMLSDHMEGRKVSLQESWITLSGKIGNVAITLVIVSVIVSLGTFLYLIPGLLLAALLLLSIPHSAQTNSAFDKSIQFSFRFLFSEFNFFPILLIVLVGFLLQLIPFVGMFIGNLFISIWIPYAFLQYGGEEARPA